MRPVMDSMYHFQGGTAGNEGTAESYVTYSASILLAMAEYNSFQRNMTQPSRRKRDTEVYVTVSP